MKEFLPHIFLFVLPLFCGNILHMLVVKYNLFSFLAKPLSEKYFGAGKTWRGFVLMPLFCGLFSVVFNYTRLPDSLYIGLILGFVYVLAELPNSFVKRKLGIKAGESTQGYRFLQLVIDKLDSLVALSIVYYFLVMISIPMVLELLAFSFTIHILFSFLLYKAGIKKTI